MSNTDKAQTSDKAKNYSDNQVEQLFESEPVSYEDCVAFAKEWGKSPRSVIAKVKSLDLEYIPKPKPAKKVSGGPTKAELVEKIESELNCSDYLAGLEKATASALVNLLGTIKIVKANG